MRPCLVIVLVLLLATGMITATGAQQRKVDKSASTAKKPETPTETQKTTTDDLDTIHKQALSLLDVLFVQAKDLDDVITRIRLQASIADILWPYDESHARSQFDYAFHTIDSVKRGTPDSFGKIDQLTDPQFQLRQEIIKLVNRHDSSFAKELMNSVIPSSKDKKPAGTSSITGNAKDRAAILVRLADECVDEDIQAAGAYLMDSLNYDIPSQFMWVLLKIRATNGALADQIFARAIQFAGNHIDPGLLILKELAVYALPDYMKDSLSSGNAFDFEFMDRLYQSPSSQTRLFLDFVYAVIMRQSSTDAVGSNGRSEDVNGALLYYNLQKFLPYFDQYDPDRAAAIRDQIGILKQGLSQMAIAMGGNLATPVTVDSEVKRAEQDSVKNPDGADISYYSAAILAAREGDMDRAMNLIDKTRNQVRRNAARELFIVEAIQIALKKQDPDKASKLGKDLSNPVLQSLVLCQIGNYWLKKDDTPRAKDSFEEAAKRINSADASPERGKASLLVTAGMTKADLIRGFELMKDSIHLINQDDAKPSVAESTTKIYDAKPEDQVSILINGYKKQSYERAGLGMASLDDGLSLLAQADYFQALLWAQTLENKTTRLRAELAVCRGALKKTETKTQKSR